MIVRNSSAIVSACKELEEQTQQKAYQGVRATVPY